MYQLPCGVGIKWKDCANLSGVVTLPSTARSPVIITRIPPDGVGCESHVVTLCTTVWNWSVCGVGGANTHTRTHAHARAGREEVVRC